MARGNCSGILIIFYCSFKHSPNQIPKKWRPFFKPCPPNAIRIYESLVLIMGISIHFQKPSYRIVCTSVGEVPSASHNRVYVWPRGGICSIYTSSNGPLSWTAAWLLSIAGTCVRLPEKALTGTTTNRQNVICRTPLPLHERFADFCNELYRWEMNY